jgi:hypothetical protein
LLAYDTAAELSFPRVRHLDGTGRAFSSAVTHPLRMMVAVIKSSSNSNLHPG